MYQLKYLIGLVLSLPSIYYTSVGCSVYKAESFEPFRAKFSDSAFIIDCFSEIRLRWGREEPFPYTPNKIPDWVTQSLPPDYVLKVVKLLDDMITDYLSRK
jgi:hypothetical protein